MSDAELDKAIKKLIGEHIDQLRKRLTILEGIASGEIQVKRIKVKEYDVASYTVSSHYRVIPVRTKTRQATVRKRGIKA
jgi:hypothetical protein